MPGQHATTTPESRRLAAIELASRSAATFRRTARRYSLCSDDAEDAYQRSLEILLTKAPTDDLRQLRPWLQTVVKHEALAVRAQRERQLGTGEPEGTSVDLAPGPDERAPQRERARQTAEALGQLKRSELQCMLLKALGYSYDEIAEKTGYSWTKVNRSLSEGRKSFFDRYEQISSGASCERLAPALAAAAAGGIEPGAGGELLTHIQGCASCRASLRRRRRAGAGVELLSPALILPALRGSWWARAQDAVTGSLIDRVALAAAKLQQLAEAATVHKTAAVVASTAALAGGAAVERRADLDRAKSAKPAIAQRSHPQRATALASSSAPSRERVARSEPEPEPRPAATAGRAPPATVASPDSAGEFAPAPAASRSQPPTAPASTDRPQPTNDEEFMP